MILPVLLGFGASVIDIDFISQVEIQVQKQANSEMLEAGAETGRVIPT